MILRLVSYATCPFVQRAELVLQHKGVAHETTYIDLRDKPAWFLAISPRGKVPVLVADGRPIFESQAVCEFLEETHPDPPLMSRDPFFRARDRAFFVFASEDIFPAVSALTGAAERASFEAARGKLEERFARLAIELGAQPFLSGDGSRFGMADVAFAPAFARLGMLARHGLFKLPDSLAPVRAWCERVLALPAMPKSVPPDWEERMMANLRKKDAFLLRVAPSLTSATLPH